MNKKLEKALDVFVSLGACVVILGAWAKLLHKPYANAMLTVGLLTEAAIFAAYGLQRIFTKTSAKADNSHATTDTTSIDNLNETLKSLIQLINSFKKALKNA